MKAKRLIKTKKGFYIKEQKPKRSGYIYYDVHALNEWGITLKDARKLDNVRYTLDRFTNIKYGLPF